mgnify:CR=1 FL=1
MVKTKYQCEVCKGDFDNNEEASEHEKIPVKNADLPRGLVVFDTPERNNVHIVGEKSILPNIYHEAVYCSYDIYLLSLDNRLSVSGAFKLDQYFTLSFYQSYFSKIENPIQEQIAEIMKSILPSDSELEEIKKRIRKSEREERLEVIKVTLEDLTNKLK